MSFSFIRTRLEPFVTTHNDTRTQPGQYASRHWVLFLQMPLQLPHSSTTLQFSLIYTWPWQNTNSCHKSGLVRNHGLLAIHLGMKTANLHHLSCTFCSPSFLSTDGLTPVLSSTGGTMQPKASGFQMSWPGFWTASLSAAIQSSAAIAHTCSATSMEMDSLMLPV